MTHFKLANLEGVDAAIIADHRQWFDTNAPAFLKKHIENKPFYWGFNQDPKAWSGSRLFETKIKPDQAVDPSVFNAVELFIKKEKFQVPAEAANAKEFIARYKKYLEILKERFLYKVVQEIFNKLKEPIEEKSPLNSKLNEFQTALMFWLSPINLQTRDACLQAHGFLTVEYFNKLKKEPGIINNAASVQQLEELEIRTKRWIDNHYRTVKKQTRRESIIETISTTGTGLGLVTGITAAFLGIGSIFMPALLLPAIVLGYISMISYMSTAASAYQIFNNAINHKRSPSTKEVISLAIDLVLLPLNFIGGAIAGTLNHITQKISMSLSAHRATIQVINTINDLWNNVFSNVTDIFYIKEVTKGSVAIVKQIAQKIPINNSINLQLKQSLSAVSWAAVRKALLQQGNTAADALKIVEKTKTNILNQRVEEQIKAGRAEISNESEAGNNNESTRIKNEPNSTSSKPLKLQRSFIYIWLPEKNMPDKKIEELTYHNSFHADILSWDAGFFSIKTSAEAKKIRQLIVEYEKLNFYENSEHNTNYQAHYTALVQKRRDLLMQIATTCNSYLTSKAPHKEKHGRYQYVESLHKNVSEEIINLDKISSEIEKNADLKPVLVSFKQS